jgi:dolichyl-diphosphooligosaccharide--protein glycosyltransferase/undecaprenyl-diphosphooligosaccharide--protein glycosyltransferase
LWTTLGVYAFVGAMWVTNTLHSNYFTRAVIDNESFKYFGVVNTISEAGHIDYNVLMHRISGSIFGFVVGVVGLFMLIRKYPIMIISAPLLVLGFFAIRGGLRFTIFAVPIMALADAYVVYYIANKVSNKQYFRYFIGVLMMMIFILPNYQHLKQYIVPTVFNHEEVQVLDKLKHIAKRDDYVLAWWDYGYPIRYYADVKTLVDGAKHSGDVNFLVSYALTHDLHLSRNMAILDVYQTQYNYTHHINDTNYLKDLMHKYGYKDVDSFLQHLGELKLPHIKSDVYYYLPFRMFDILPTITMFSEINLKNGKIKDHFFVLSRTLAQKDGVVTLQNGIKIDLNNNTVDLGSQIPIKNFAITFYDKDLKLHKLSQLINSDGLDVIYLKTYNQWLVIDDFYLKSAFIQLFVFENTQGLFTPVILTPWVKVFRVNK